MTIPFLHPDRLFPVEPQLRAIARRLYGSIAELPIISPHGHTDPNWYADDQPFADPASLLVIPDHYIFRMLYAQGVPLENLGVPRVDGGEAERDPRAIWRLFAAHWHLFRGTPTRIWFDHALSTLFDINQNLSSANADKLYDCIAEKLAQPAYHPRALFKSFNIEVIATTEGALNPLDAHRRIRESGWDGRVVTTYRPDSVVDPDFEDFAKSLVTFGEITGCDTTIWSGYIDAHRKRRAFFKSYGATATDHGHPIARTSNLS